MVNTLATCVALAFTLFVILLGCWFFIILLTERRLSRETSALRGRIEILSRWCAWHYPIIDDACDFLLDNGGDISSFRERMIAKYGERPLTPEERKRAEGIQQARCRFCEMTFGHDQDCPDLLRETRLMQQAANIQSAGAQNQRLGR